MKNSGCKLSGLLFGGLGVSFLGFFLLFACLMVILTAFMIQQLPFGHADAYVWYLEERPLTSQANYGFPLQGYAGSAQAIEGLPVPHPVTSHFGYSHDYFGGRRYHTGVDMACPTGTPVSNVMSGRVTFAGYNDAGYGNLVIVENQGVQSFYGHLSRVNVQPGQVLQAGEIVGAVGNTGFSTGPHLHWEVRVNGATVDPLQTTLPGAGSGGN